MRILVDANFLIYLLDSREGGRQGVRDRRAKLQDILAQVQQARGSVLIPTPVLAEYLTHARSAGPDIVEGLQKNKRIRVVPFDLVAAQEAALLHRAAWDAGGHKRAPLPQTADWQRVKVDWQIVAIAKVHGARMVTNDRQLFTLAQAAGLQADLLDQMPVPPSRAQMVIEGVEPLPLPELLVTKASSPSA